MGDLKGMRMPRYNVGEGAMVGRHKCRMFKGSDDDKVQCREGAMVGGNKCVRFKGSEDDA